MEWAHAKKEAENDKTCNFLNTIELAYNIFFENSHPKKRELQQDELKMGLPK